MKIRKTKKGFTIVELVIVIAVIGILAAILVPTFIGLTSRANEASDNALVNNLNKALKLQEGEQGKKPETFQGAIDNLKKEGYLLEQLSTRSGKTLVWDLKEDQFVLNPTSLQTGANYWKIVENTNDVDAQNYSIYAGQKWTGNASGFKYGFDAGEKTDIEEITYTNTGAAQEVIIRTNGGNLTINAPEDSVKHYGVANVVDIQAIKHNSYHEHDKTTFLKVKTGRVVLEANAEVGGIHAVATDDAGDKYFNNIKIAVVSETTPLPEITRDLASIDEITNEGEYSQYVLEVQTSVTSSEYVWANLSISGALTVSNNVVSKETVTEEAKASKEIKQEETEASEGVSEIAEQIAQDTDNAVSEEEAKESASDVVTPTFDEKVVARVSTTGYESLKDALDNVNADGKVVVLKDIDEFPGYLIDKSLTLDLGGHTITGVTDFSKINPNTNNRLFKAAGSAEVKVINGKIVATATSNVAGYNSKGKPVNANNTVLSGAAGGSGFYGAFRSEGSSTLVLEDLVLENSRPWGMNVKVTEGTNAVLRNVTINSRFGGGIEAAGGYTLIENCEFHQSEYFDWNSGCIAVSGIAAYGGVVVRNSTMVIDESSFETTAQGNFAIYVFSSGGKITVEDGTFSAIKDVIILGHDTKTYPSNTSDVEIKGGTFNGTLNSPEKIVGDISYNNLVIKGGTFDHDPSAFVDSEHYTVTHSGNTWVVTAK